MRPDQLQEVVVNQQTRAKHAQTANESWRGFFLEDEADGVGAWSTDQLFTEVLQRSADDAPTLRRMQENILQALLAAV
jgi:hypothetical protein